jgi:hypothetical protein
VAAVIVAGVSLPPRAGLLEAGGLEWPTGPDGVAGSGGLLGRPVLDGLDEIASVEHRRACVAAIDAYAGRGEPHRPFVLTCRAREYRELAPDWVRDDDCVMLVGLQPDQIRRRLNEATAGRSAWTELRKRQAAGDLDLPRFRGVRLLLLS